MAALLDRTKVFVYLKQVGVPAGPDQAAPIRVSGEDSLLVRPFVDGVASFLVYDDARVFCVRPWRGQGFVDLPAVQGGVNVMPWATNRAFTHEVPAPGRATGRRISLTLRAFHD